MDWLHTPTGAGAYGEHWTLLAHQYIAAKLNYLSGIDPSGPVGNAMLDANELLTQCEVVPDADAASDLATTLDAFNNGAEGTADCGDKGDDDDDDGGDDGEDDDGDEGDGGEGGGDDSGMPPLPSEG